MYNPFTKHPNSVGETYLEHMKIALSTAIKIQLVVLIIVVHAIFPFLFEKTGGDEIEKINKDLQYRRGNERKLD
jgi:hypothetical protein